MGVLIWLIGLMFSAGIAIRATQTNELDSAQVPLLAQVLILLFIWPLVLGYIVALNIDITEKEADENTPNINDNNEKTS